MSEQQGNRRDFSERAHTAFQYWLSMASIAKLQIKSAQPWSIFPYPLKLETIFPHFPLAISPPAESTGKRV